jgi:hypothetical protein
MDLNEKRVNGFESRINRVDANEAAWKKSGGDRRCPVFGERFCRGDKADDGQYVRWLRSLLNAQEFIGNIEKRDEVYCAQLAVFAVFLDGKLTVGENDGILVRFVFIVKKAGTDLAQPERGD